MSLLTERAYTLLHAGPMTTRELSENLGVPYGSVRAILEPLRADGRIQLRWVKPQWKGNYGSQKGVAVYEVLR